MNQVKNTHFIVVVYSIKMGSRSIMCLDYLSFNFNRIERLITEDHLFRWVMHLMYVFILHTNNQTSKKCLCKFGQMIMHPPVYMHKLRSVFYVPSQKMGFIECKVDERVSV